MQKVEESVTDHWNKPLYGLKMELSAQGRSMPMSVHRSKERSTSLREMRTDETIATPFVVVPCVSMEIELHEQGCPPAKVIYARREEGFTTGELYEQWARVVLFY
jgi:hypothetical protein